MWRESVQLFKKSKFKLNNTKVKVSSKTTSKNLWELNNFYLLTNKFVKS